MQRAAGGQQHFYIAVVGGGIAGTSFAGVMARAGFGVLVIEKEERFRERVRGDATHAWGVYETQRSVTMSLSP